MTIQQMLKVHPLADVSEDIEKCINACFECAATCTSCADACLAERHVDSLVRCIGLNVTCAEICEVTGRALLRQMGRDWSVLTSLLQACETECRICRMECEMHASMHEHCRICAEICARCESACHAAMRVAVR